MKKITFSLQNILKAIALVFLGVSVLIVYQWFKSEGGCEPLYSLVGVIASGFVWLASQKASREPITLFEPSESQP